MSLSSNQFQQHNFPASVNTSGNFITASSNVFADISFPVSTNTFNTFLSASSNAFSSLGFPAATTVWGGENTHGGVYGDPVFYGAGPYGGFGHFNNRAGYTISR